MNNFYNKFTFVLAFLIAVLIINMSLGNKFTEYFLILILLGMLLMNADVFSNLTNYLKGE